MNASTIMLLAIGASVVGKWSNNRKITGKAVVEGVFAMLVITIMDAGPAQPIARGFAWLFFASVLLGNSSPLTGVTRATGGHTNANAVKGVL